MILTPLNPYARVDLTFADRLAEALKAQGFELISRFWEEPNGRRDLVLAIAVLASLMPIVIAIWSRCVTCVWLSTIVLLANLGLILATPQIIYFVAEVGASIGHNVVKGLVEERQLRFPWYYPQGVR